jgi:hypothetical protein
MRVRILASKIKAQNSVNSAQQAHILHILACHLQIDVHADPDPAFHLDADPDPNPACHFDGDPDPDPTLPFDAGPDPSFKIRAQKLEKVLK